MRLLNFFQIRRLRSRQRTKGTMSSFVSRFRERYRDTAAIDVAFTRRYFDTNVTSLFGLIGLPISSAGGSQHDDFVATS